MHSLASHYQSEFLATPQLIRFDYVQGGSGFEPTFLIKAKSLLLKYIVQGVRMQLRFSLVADRLLYALKVFDDEKGPAILWSILERVAEKAALEALVRGDSCQIFLFNELAANVAWTSLSITAEANLMKMLASTLTGSFDHDEFTREITAILDRSHNDQILDSNLIVVDLPTPAVPCQWKVPI